MFTQLDADPHAGQAPSTILTSDDLANNLRDGSNSRYLLDLATTAVSGSFTVHVTTPGGDSVDVTITPVYFPNGGPVDPVATTQVIHDALSALSIVGINWPQAGFGQAFEGPIEVRWMSAGELAQLVGTAWDPATHGINTNFYVYEITFMGELHDTQIGLSYVAASSTLTGAPGTTSTRQSISFPASAAAGWYSMTVNGVTTPRTPTTSPAILSITRARSPRLCRGSCRGRPARTIRLRRPIVVIFPTAEPQIVCVPPDLH